MAVSGGVDSVVLLHMLVNRQEHDLLVAHLDHGIRPDSADDERFVAGLAAQYGLPFYSQRKELGVDASEDTARKARYAFLREIAAQHDAVIVTAHHSDDVIETIAINISRGTGWRGVAVLGSVDIGRPLLGMSKREIYQYALHHRLEWVEDSTNRSPRYLRNKIRIALTDLEDAAKQQLLQLHKEQQQLSIEVAAGVERLLTPATSKSRYFFTCIEMDAAVELLDVVVRRATHKNLLSAQLERGVIAIRTAAPKSTADLGEGVELVFRKQSFIARQRQKML